MSEITLAGYLANQFSVAQNLEFFIRILTASFCGGCIGLERSRRLKVAGVRTHVIVCTAAALLMIVSKYGFADLTQHVAGAAVNFNGTRGADPARVAAQVVSGISFLGAGVIFKHGDSIKGLTTAAIIWATAGIGLALGAGMYVVGIFTTAAVVAMQILMHKVPFGTDSQLYYLELAASDEAALQAALDGFLEKHNVLVVRSEFVRKEDGTLYNVTLRIPHTVSMRETERYFQDLDGVTSVVCSAV